MEFLAERAVCALYIFVGSGFVNSEDLVVIFCGEDDDGEQGDRDGQKESLEIHGVPIRRFRAISRGGVAGVELRCS